MYVLNEYQYIIYNIICVHIYIKINRIFIIPLHISYNLIILKIYSWNTLIFEYFNNRIKN